MHYWCGKLFLTTVFFSFFFLSIVWIIVIKKFFSSVSVENY
ncbi:hypothetical protein D352_01331 [Enterococcus faecium LA4B-2]|nr:hypothetical protein D352_01331 [Enterococcus faecium LA4B-2]